MQESWKIHMKIDIPIQTYNLSSASYFSIISFWTRNLSTSSTAISSIYWSYVYNRIFNYANRKKLSLKASTAFGVTFETSNYPSHFTTLQREAGNYRTSYFIQEHITIKIELTRNFTLISWNRKTEISTTFKTSTCITWSARSCTAYR